MYQQCLDFNGQVSEICVRRLSDGAIISLTEESAERQAFLKYQAEGGKVYGADEPLPADEVTQ